MKRILMWLGLISDPVEIAKRKSVQELHSDHVQVVRISVFDDDTAYHGQRGIYIITDKISGKSFIGVSGVGISELGSHSEGVGKSRRTVRDER